MNNNDDFFQKESNSIKLNDEIINGLRNPDTDSKERDIFFTKLANKKISLSKINDNYLSLIQRYFATKIFDHDPLTEDELASFYLLPEEYTLPHTETVESVKVKVTDELLQKAIHYPELVSEDEQNSLHIVVQDRIFDGDLDDLVTKYAEMYGIEVFLLSDLTKDSLLDFCLHEYGYNIYDRSAVKHYLTWNIYRYQYPISKRECKIIQRVHNFDPKMRDVGF